MSGTREGGKRAAETNRASDPDFYRKVGKLGGSVPHKSTRYWHMNPDAAVEAGRKGGAISKRRKKGDKVDEPDLQAIDEALWDRYVEWCETNEVRPKMKHYRQWLDENFV
jgi:general stress protein YciG